MKKYLFLLWLICVNNFMMALPKTNTYFKITASDPLKKVIKGIAKSNVFEYTSKTGISSQQNKRYEELLKTATTDELTELATSHKNAVVRLYAFRALVLKLKDIPKEMIDQFKNDTTIVSTVRDGITGKTPVNEIASGFLY